MAGGRFRQHRSQGGGGQQEVAGRTPGTQGVVQHPDESGRAGLVRCGVQCRHAKRLPEPANQRCRLRAAGQPGLDGLARRRCRPPGQPQPAQQSRQCPAIAPAQTARTQQPGQQVQGRGQRGRVDRQPVDRAQAHRPAPQGIGRHADLFHQCQAVPVGAHDQVLPVVQRERSPGHRQGDCARAAPGLCRRFEHGDGPSRLGERHRRSQTGPAGADDHDRGCRDRARPCARSRRWLRQHRGCAEPAPPRTCARRARTCAPA